MQTEITEALRDKAETIRAYLSAARGGAIFLSAADAELLVSWLQSGIPPAAIMTAIDRLAKKRQSKLSRRRFTLKSCKGELNKLLKIKKVPKQLNQHNGLATLAQQIKSMPIHVELRSFKADLINQLLEISKQEKDRDEMATTAIDACQRFQDAAWQQAQEESELLLIAAEDELEPLKEMLGAALYKEALTEHMSNTVRSRYPLCTAQAVWTAMNAAKEME